MRKIISVVLLMSIIFVSLFSMPTLADVSGSGITIKDTKIYTNAGTDNTHALPGETSSPIKDPTTDTNIIIPKGSTFSVLGSKIDGDGDLWYKVNCNNIVGYLYKGWVRITTYYDEDFEKNLSNFPSEYHDSLRALHNEYPNWRFFAEPTGCTYSEALDNEYCPGEGNRPRKLVELTYMGEDWRDPRAKLPNGSYENAEGNRWTYASRMAISYFMNPRNFLNADDIFMFLKLSDNNGSHTRDMLKTVVFNTFLNEDKYIDAIMEAAAATKLSPLAIASIILVEQGKGGSSLISGNYLGYEGYYNFFNIGASGKGNDEIVKSGLEYAKSKGWNSISASIIGGAEKSTNAYISAGQDTYYYMDYNVVIGNYNNQYATAIYDAYNKGRRLASSCKINKNAVLDFIIPVFSSTPPAPEPIVDPTPTPSPQPQPTPTPIIKYGDINGDNTIDEVDLAAVKLHILNRRPLSGTSLTAADTNKDGVIDEVDLAAVKLDILGRRKINN